MLRKNKTFNNLDLNDIGLNSNINITNNNNKYEINGMNKINITDKNNNNLEDYSNSVKYTTTSGGSIVSIHNNKIHGLPILQGVCPRCINSELIILKELNKKINKYSPIQDYNYDIL